MLVRVEFRLLVARFYVYSCYFSVNLTPRGTNLMRMCPSILPILFSLDIICNHHIHSPYSLYHSWVFISLAYRGIDGWPVGYDEYIVHVRTVLILGSNFSPMAN